MVCVEDFEIEDGLVPSEGKWLCEELNMLLSFESDDPWSSFMLNGQKIKCLVRNEIGTSDIFLVCQDADSSDYKLGESIFSGACVSLDESEFVLKEYTTGEYFVFKKTTD